MSSFAAVTTTVQDSTGAPSGTRYPASTPVTFTLPLFSSRVPAGFPSPADDHQEDSLDLNDLLVKRPAATFIVDRSLEPKSGDVVIAVVNGELTVKRLKLDRGGVWLMPENPEFHPLEIRDGLDLMIWGVVAHVVHSL